jgi:hypothetical protein
MLGWYILVTNLSWRQPHPTFLELTVGALNGNSYPNLTLRRNLPPAYGPVCISALHEHTHRPDHGHVPREEVVALGLDVDVGEGVGAELAEFLLSAVARRDVHAGHA